MHGTGTLVYANGHKYVGQFERDERHGFGRYTSSNGDVYEGEFVRDKRCGKGVYRMANGAVYEGEFKNGMPNGTGSTCDGGVGVLAEREPFSVAYLEGAQSMCSRRAMCTRVSLKTMNFMEAEHIEVPAAPCTVEISSTG